MATVFMVMRTVMIGHVDNGDDNDCKGDNSHNDDYSTQLVINPVAINDRDEPFHNHH